MPAIPVVFVLALSLNEFTTESATLTTLYRRDILFFPMAEAREAH